MEVRPSPDWSKPGEKFYVALVSLHNGVVEFKNIEVWQKPTVDRDDRNTGFKVAEREYNWSGYIGNATVISFDEAFKYHTDDIKFVFWTEM